VCWQTGRHLLYRLLAHHPSHLWQVMDAGMRSLICPVIPSNGGFH
jgi:hypothetical protein